jgi:hypothetical protein
MTEKLRKQLEALELAATSRKRGKESPGIKSMTVPELSALLAFADRAERGERNFTDAEWAEMKRLLQLSETPRRTAGNGEI